MPRRPDDDEGFLGRWSRRKRSGVEIDAEAAPEATSEPGAEVTDTPADPEHTPITPEELAALPKIEDLVAGSDIRGFLRPGVPRALKNAALRRMWMLTPAIRDHADPAVDYAWDWNTPGGVPGDGLAPAPERAAAMLRGLRAQPDGGERTGPEAAPASPPQRRPDTAASAPPAAAEAGPAGAEEDAQPEAESAPARAGYGRAERAGGASSPDDLAAEGLSKDVPPAALRCPDTESAPRPGSPPARRRHGGARPE